MMMIKSIRNDKNQDHHLAQGNDFDLEHSENAIHKTAAP